MSFEIEGKLHKVFETEQKTESFRTREFVIETQQGQYAQFIKFQLTQDKCDAIDPFNEGQQIKVYFDLRGRQWQDKFFTNLQAWRVEGIGASQPAPMPELDSEGDFESSRVDNSDSGANDFDDLPF